MSSVTVGGAPQSADAARATTRGLGPRKTALAMAADWAVARAGLVAPVVFISGFWRSGTTWLQEVLADSIDAKTVFEPLSPRDPVRRSILDRAGITDYAFSEAHIPLPAGPDDPLWISFDRTLISGRCSQFSYSCRTGVRNSLKRRIVIKDVRMQFNLAGVHERYDIPVIHIRRNPIAIANSLISTAWPWTFDDVRLTQMLPGRDAELAEFDTDAVSRISALWAVTERFVDNTLADRPWARIIDYKQVVTSARSQIPELCSFIGHPQRKVPDYAAPSASTLVANGPKLDLAQIERVRQIVSALYPEFVFDGPADAVRVAR